MLFSSMTFIYFFLPIVLLLYLETKKELHNPILLVASIIFYAWGEPKYLSIMLLTILLTIVRCIVNIWLLVLLFLSTITIASSTYNPFIYFRF